MVAALVGTAEVILGPGNGDLMPRQEVLQMGAELDGIINQGELRADAELLDHCPRLRIVANIAAGTENLDGALMAQRGVWATNTPGVYCQATADLTLAFLLCLARRVLCADAFVRSGKWDQFQPGVWDGDLLEGRKGDKNIPIEQIASIQLKPASTLLAGHITIVLPESKEGFMLAGLDDCTVEFVKREEEKFVEIKAFLDARIGR